MNPVTIINQSRCWIKSVVIACNFCPFAQRELERESIRFVVSGALKIDSYLQQVVDE